MVCTNIPIQRKILRNVRLPWDRGGGEKIKEGKEEEENGGKQP